MNTDRMSCGEAREKLPLFVGGDLDSDVLDAVRAHLDGCADCARRAGEALRARRELVGALRARDAGLTGPGLWPGIRSALRAEGLVHEARPVATLPAAAARARGTRWTWALVPATAAAVFLALVQIGGFLSQGPALPNDGSKPIAEHQLDGTRDMVATPVSAPAGGLQRVDPSEALLLRSVRAPVRYQPLRRVEGSAPEGGAPDAGISLTGLNGFK